MISKELQGIINKISAISEGSTTFNVLERDLIKTYLLQAYELVSADTAVANFIATVPAAPAIDDPVKIEEVVPPVADPILEPPTLVNQVISVPLEDEPEIASPPQPTFEKPLSSSLAESTHDIRYVPNGNTDAMPQDNVLVNLLHANVIDKKYAKLFELEKSAELSERLSSSPLPNLPKAIGINDRLLYQNELFSGDPEAFNETLDMLNNKPDYESAQVFLTRHIVDKYEWLNDAKLDRAREFVKLVARRFNQ